MNVKFIAERKRNIETSKSPKIDGPGPKGKNSVNRDNI
jgi:hypothetical protein